MDKKRLLFLFLGLVFFWAVAVCVFRWDPTIEVRWINDNNDKLIYMQRAAWVVEGSIPYKDVFSEYPQVPNYLFSVPFIVLSIFQPIETVNSFQYTALFSFMMLAFLALTIILLYRLLPENKDRAFLLLLPASLYFTFNRFDILPAYLTLLSIALVYRNKMSWAVVLLGIGTMTKWYPALLFPIYLTFEFHQTKKINWRMVAVFLTTIIIVVSPTYITGGWEAIKVPYSAHLARGFELVSLPALIQRIILAPLDIEHISNFLGYGFLFLQFLPAMLSPFLRLDTKESVARWSIISIGFFIIFSQIYSPQWLLWFLPFLIIVSRTRKDIFYIVLYDLLIYLAFPVITDTMGVTSGAMVILNSISLALLITILIRTFKQMEQKLSLENAQSFFLGALGK